MKISLLSVTLLFLIPLAQLFAADAPKSLKVFILAGQSNMGGRLSLIWTARNTTTAKGHS